VGTDYQGLGFGRALVELAINQAWGHGPKKQLNFLSTSVWQHNKRSQDILRWQGFVALDLTKGEGVRSEEGFTFWICWVWRARTSVAKQYESF